MNDTAAQSSDLRESGFFLAFAFILIILLSLVIGIFLSYQISLVTETRSQLKAQFNGIQQQIDAQVAQSRLIQSGLETIVRDLIDLADSGDADAKQIIEKYGIKVNPPAGAKSPAPPK